MASDHRIDERSLSIQIFEVNIGPEPRQEFHRLALSIGSRIENSSLSNESVDDIRVCPEVLHYMPDERVHTSFCCIEKESLAIGIQVIHIEFEVLMQNIKHLDCEGFIEDVFD